MAAAPAKSFQSCLTLCDPIDSSPPGSPIPLDFIHMKCNICFSDLLPSVKQALGSSVVCRAGIEIQT